jgi:hypothetical protein
VKPRLFVFGDSWALDYFKEPFLNSKEVEKYSKYYSQFGHWTNHMENFFEVQNFAEGASSIENTIYQLGNLPEYKKGDRIIIIFGSPGRFSWISDNKDIRYTIGRRGYPKILQEQYIKRYEYWIRTNNNQKKFIKKLESLLSQYNPIITSWNEDFSSVFKFTYHLSWPELTHIKHESNGECNDNHLGILGNYELFKYFMNKLKINTKGYDYDIKSYKQELL